MLFRSLVDLYNRFFSDFLTIFGTSKGRNEIKKIKKCQESYNQDQTISGMSEYEIFQGGPSFLFKYEN